MPANCPLMAVAMLCKGFGDFTWWRAGKKIATVSERWTENRRLLMMGVTGVEGLTRK